MSDDPESPPQVSGDVIAQAAAIPVRTGPDGNVQVLLIRRVEKNRWGIPKGIVEPGQSLAQTAHLEALEEAGVAGVLSEKPVRRFAFRKWGGLCHVSVFLMRVTETEARYEEQAVRTRKWFSLEEAASVPLRKRIRKIIEKLPQIIAEHGMSPDHRE